MSSALRLCSSALVLSVALPSSVFAEPDPKLTIQPIKIRVALVEDPDFPGLDDGLIARWLDSAASTFAERFGVERPVFSVAARYTLEDFMHRFARPEAGACDDLYSVAYKGGGREALVPHRG